MGGNHSHFTHHMTHLPDSTTYIYTRSNKFGAVESRRTVTWPNRPVSSTITFSNGRGYTAIIQYKGCVANNLQDYHTDGPVDTFFEGDYSYLFNPPMCTCGAGCSCV
jgi:hypothetical protein